jgi:hypothetical protein
LFIRGIMLRLFDQGLRIVKQYALLPRAKVIRSCCNRDDQPGN